MGRVPTVGHFFWTISQISTSLKRNMQYLHDLFNCLEMTPAALKCQLNAVELCNLETTVFF